MPTTIQLKRGANANISSTTLLPGEPAFTLDTGRLYIGDGSSKVLINPVLGTAASANTGVSSGNVPILDSNGKLADSVVPKIAVTDTFVVNSQSAMLALSAEVGDVAIRTDISTTFILQNVPASVLSNWQQLLNPTGGGVVSVNSLTGAVTLTGSNINMTGYTIGNSAIPVNQGDSINVAIGKVEYKDSLKAPIASPTFTGTVSAPTVSASDNSTVVATTAFVKNQNYVTASTAPVTSVNTRVGAVVLNGADLLVTGYTKASTEASILTTDSINIALGKLEKRLDVIDGGLF